MEAVLIRICPTCDAENPPETLRCTCGALLAGVDLSKRREPEAGPNAGASVSIPAAAPVSLICAYDDCAQPNPPGTADCLYCNRPLSADASLARPGKLHSLLNLPSALKSRYRVLHPLPAQGAEAELLMVQPLAGGTPCVAKIYRHGIHPQDEVRQRIGKVDPRNRVVMHEAAVSDGYAYELMEFCSHGSLRDHMKRGAMPSWWFPDAIRELAGALDDVHAAGLVHRDLKPENILVRSEQPLDLVLTDFGIASVLDATQRFTGTARTLPYAAPESLSGVIDAKADYWALGIILLEAATAKHPFAGLSDAVILHHLTTRGIDLSSVQDGHLRKLISGLLVRDPKQRWGRREIDLWLAGDAALPEPAHAHEGGFATPYRIGTEVCHTGEQLAVALARNWRDGIADLMNGQLLGWFRDVQKDHNAVRLLLELRQDQKMSVDVQLLRLILFLAPGIPPVWRGESIELPAILARANAALKGDAEAVAWLHTLHQYRVLEAYVEAGNQQAYSVVQHWNAALERFLQAWKERIGLIRSKEPVEHIGGYVNIDKLLYGASAPDTPPLADMHARLLAVAYDASWTERLRKRLTAEVAAITARCSWGAELGDPGAMDASSLLVLDALLPEAKKVLELQIRAEERRREQSSRECQEIRDQIAGALAELRYYANERKATQPACDAMRICLGRYFDLLPRIQAAGNAGEDWQELMRYAARSKRPAQQLQEAIDELEERRAANAGWHNENTLGIAAGLLFVPPLFLGRAAFFLALAGVCGIAAWRWLPVLSMMRYVKEVGRRL